MKPKEAQKSASPENIPGFEPVILDGISETALSADDLESRKKQLWLIKVPYEFDVSKISGKTIFLNESQCKVGIDLNVKQDNENGEKKFEIRSATYGKNPSNFKLLVPSKENKNLEITKNFHGHIDIIQTVRIPKLEYPPKQPPMYTEIPNGLKARWKPFGHEKPKRKVNVSSTKDVKRTVKVMEENRKRKRKKKELDESGYGTISTAQQNDSVSHSNKYKKKKRQKESS